MVLEFSAKQSSQPINRHCGRHLAVVLFQHSNRRAHQLGQGVHIHLSIHQAHGGLAVVK